eukprot:scaffold221318_cov52-Attheya_sp.AAC.1
MSAHRSIEGGSSTANKLDLAELSYSRAPSLLARARDSHVYLRNAKTDIDKKRNSPYSSADSDWTTAEAQRQSVLLFSPPHQPTKERVLHSIFSPPNPSSSTPLLSPGENHLSLNRMNTPFTSTTLSTSTYRELPAIIEGKENSALVDQRKPSEANEIEGEYTETKRNTIAEKKTADDISIGSSSSILGIVISTDDMSSCMAGEPEEPKEDMSVGSRRNSKSVERSFSPNPQCALHDEVSNYSVSQFFSPQSQVNMASHIGQKWKNSASDTISTIHRSRNMISPNNCSSSSTLFSPTSTYYSGRNQTMYSDSNATLQSIPFEMLDIEYINSCESMEKLQDIVSALERDSRFPSLLKSAEARISMIQGQSKVISVSSYDSVATEGGEHMQMQQGYISASSPLSSKAKSPVETLLSSRNSDRPRPLVQRRGSVETRVSHHEPQSRTSPSPSMHRSKTEDSMIFSLSPTLSHSTKLEFDLGSRPGHRMLPSSTVSRPEIGKIPMNQDSIQRKEAPISEIEIPSDSEHTVIVGEQVQSYEERELRKSLSSMIDTHAALTAEMGEVCQEKRDIKSKLSTQVSCLTQQLKELEAKEAKKEEVFQCKIDDLQNSKEKAEQNISILENTFVTSSEKAKELVSHLRSQTVEVKSLKRKVTELTAEKKYTMSQAEEMRKSLVAEIQGLSVQLQREQTRVVSDKLALEERLRVEYEKVTSSDKGKIHKLANEIKEARSEVEHLKKEKVALTACLKSLEHKNKGKDHMLSPQIARRLDSNGYLDLIARASSAESAATALARALARSEKELIAVGKAKHKTDKECLKLNNIEASLRKENSVLSSKIETIQVELASGHKYIDKLRTDLQDYKKLQKAQKCWEKAEDGLKEDISTLQERVNASKTMVPAILYQEKVDEARDAVSKLDEKEREVRELSRKLMSVQFHVTELALARTRSANESGAPRQVSPSVDPPRNERKLYIEIPAAIDTINQSPVEQDVTPRADNRGSSFRTSVIRAAGGRAGLKAKLKQTRGALALVNQNSTVNDGKAKKRKQTNRLSSHSKENKSIIPTRNHTRIHFR